MPELSLPAMGDVGRTIAAIHAAPARLVYAFAGAGGLALYWLHAVAGSSRTVLEARDCYAPRSLAEVVGDTADGAVSPAVARAMAAWAADRAAALAEGDWPLLGVAGTAALATDRTRRGADRAWVAVWAAGAPTVYGLSLLAADQRLAQEDLVSRLVIMAIARACEGARPA